MSETLGEFESAVLLAIVRLGEGAYGVTIRRDIETRLGRSIAVGALYTAFDRLERKALIRSTTSEPLPQRGGRSRRQVSVTPSGVAALQRSHDAMQRLWAGLSPQTLKVQS